MRRSQLKQIRTKMQKEERKWAFDLSKDKYQTKREVSLSTSSSTSSSGQIIAPLGYRGDVQVSSEAGSRTGAGKGNAPATPNMKELLKKVHLSPFLGRFGPNQCTVC